ncbi:MAG: 2-oxoglutarate dehydrogenase [Microbacterium sp.]|uniref:DUF6049 family protein n=1 Tax=Microbacterium sp. TaxID=51671 RepID=UPI001AC9D1E6|nr:DUF6049 family protein [Microbacterium sp.]MBN9176882.1 2-oxoglutarate dehydrogenase [Microbacterium sp.]
MTLSPSRRARPLARAWVAVLALSAVVTVALGLASPAVADDDAASDASSIALTVAPSGAGVVSTSSALALTLSAYNPTLADLDAGAVHVTTSATALGDRAATRAWLSGDTGDGADASALARTETVLADTTLPRIASRATGATTISLDPAAFAARTPGVYPVRADYTTPQGVVTARTVLVVPGAGTGGSVSVVVPITAPALSTGLLTADELTTLTAPGGDLRSALDAVTGSTSVLAVDPAIVAAIRVLGSAAPASASAWLTDLMALPNPRFALQFGDADLATQITAGLGTPLEPLPLDPYMAARDFRAASGTPSAAPSPSPNSSSSAPDNLPTLAQLTDVGGTGDTVLWPATGTAGTETVRALASASSFTLIDSSAVTDAAAPAWATATDAGDARLLVYDADTSRALGAAAASEATPTRDAALAAASAYAQFAASDAGAGTLLVTVDRTAAAPSLRAALQTASSLAGRTAVADIAALTSGGAAPVTLHADAVDDQRVDELHTLLSDEGELQSFSSILADPTVLTSPERAAILQLIGNGWRTATADAAATAFTDHRTQTRDTLGAVAITPPVDITLAASSAPLSFSVRNDLRWPVSVVLFATRNDPRLIVQGTTPVEAGPSQNTRVQVPVQARVGSGESTLELQLRSATGVTIGDTVPVHVSVHAEWESVGLVIMITLVAALLILGIVRTVLKLRRRRAGASTPEAAPEAAPEAGEREDADG